VSAELEQHQREEAALQERLHSIQQQAQEAEQTLSLQTELPKASMFNYKNALEQAHSVIENQNKALAERWQEPREKESSPHKMKNNRQKSAVCKKP
jgi:hypothetical protein